MAFLTQFRDHALHHIGRHGKADANRTAGRAEDCRIHANHAAIPRKERTAGIALIDRRIHLDEIIIGASANVAASGRNHASGHSAGQAIGIAHGHHPIAGLGTIRITQSNEGQRRARFHLQQRDIGTRIAANQAGLQFAAVFKLYGDAVGAFHNMVIGHDEAGGINDEARTRALHAALAGVGHAHFAARLLAGNIDGDNGRADRLHKLSKAGGRRGAVKGDRRGNRRRGILRVHGKAGQRG